MIKEILKKFFNALGYDIRKLENTYYNLYYDIIPKDSIIISGIREIKKSFGTGVKVPSKDEIEMKKSFRKSIVANTDIRKGETITPEMLSIKRPGTGLSPKYFDFIVGKKAKRDMKYDDLIINKYGSFLGGTL